jgi:hypothetical protein
MWYYTTTNNKSKIIFGIHDARYYYAMILCRSKLAAMTLYTKNCLTCDIISRLTIKVK